LLFLFNHYNSVAGTSLLIYESFSRAVVLKVWPLAWGCSYLVKCLPSLCKALGSVLTTEKESMVLGTWLPVRNTDLQPHLNLSNSEILSGANESVLTALWKI
jgi:hypothetical protein